jgi:trehalose 6-phosphate synthase/phosphatase
MMKPGRVIIVSNRLPVVAQRDRGPITLKPACGGVATGLHSVHKQAESLWIGWLGTPCSPTEPACAALVGELRHRRLRSVPLDVAEAHSYYDGVCNAVLWPLFHYQIDRLPVDLPEWDVYRAVNERFADAIVHEYRPGDTIWIHDYHLLLVPDLVRKRLPQARIGFFLHIPFPATDVFRITPWRDEILHGLLGADVVGFHTPAYAAHFADAVESILGLPAEGGRIAVGGRDVRTGAYPMGVDSEAFAHLANQRTVREERDELVGSRQVRLLVGIDRLDYTKGIPRRLLAYERLLRDSPELHGRVRLIQVAVPSRDTVVAYQRFRKEIEEAVGRINGEYGTPAWTPIHYLHHALTREQLAALYLAADVMLVTPLRDGMNLIAKEFVATRSDSDGVLVLSEFAGAAAQLPEAIQVNPYAIDNTAHAMAMALSMPPAERRMRMQALRARVKKADLGTWVVRFLDDLVGAPLSTTDVPCAGDRRETDAFVSA